MVTPDDVRHVAALARLAIDDERMPGLVRELNTILGHMEVLSRVDTGKHTATNGPVDAAQPLREDGGLPLPLARPREAFAPATRDGFLIVPRLATHETLGEDT